MPFVYRFIDDKGNILYVGKTKDLGARMAQHFGVNGHLSKQEYGQVMKVQYIEFPTENDIGIMERALIATWQPSFNKAYAESGRLTIAIKIPEENEWVDYKKHDVIKCANGGDIKKKTGRIQSNLEKQIESFLVNFDGEYVCSHLVYDGIALNVKQDLLASKIREISKILDKSQYVERVERKHRFTGEYKRYGVQRAWKKKDALSLISLDEIEENHTVDFLVNQIKTELGVFSGWKRVRKAAELVNTCDAWENDVSSRKALSAGVYDACLQDECAVEYDDFLEMTGLYRELGILKYYPA